MLRIPQGESAAASHPVDVPPDVRRREAACLAPWGFPSSACAGRLHAERGVSRRGPFAEDRERVVRCSAFRRLGGKLQVFTEDRGDYHRTRLTHTLEVAASARGLARVLRLNEDLTEALALVHDLGHPPFGHAGEEVLAELAAADGGFDHNRHGLRVVQHFEQTGLPVPGLNLTCEVLQGQRTRTVKHAAPSRPILEVQVVEAADSATYDTHDADDALALGLLTLPELLELPLWKQAAVRVRRRWAALTDDELRRALLLELTEWQFDDLFAEAEANIHRRGIGSPADCAAAPPLVVPSAELAAWKDELERFLFVRVYRHPVLEAMRSRARGILEAAFAELLARPERLPPRFRPDNTQPSLPRAIVEFLACQTDRSVQTLDETAGDGETLLATPYLPRLPR